MLKTALSQVNINIQINIYIYINIYKYIVSVYINGGLPPTAVYKYIYIYI